MWQEKMNEKVKQACDSYLFERNTEENRRLLAKLLSELLENIVPYRYKVVCDETNNTEEAMTEGKLCLDILVENSTFRFKITN